MDDGSSLVDTSTNTIRWDNSAEVVIVETGTSGLTAGEAATLELLNDLTEDVGGIRFTAQALEEAPSGGGSLTAAQVRIEMDTNSTQLADIKRNTNLIPAAL
jgi:hypothetical protein